MSPSGEVYSVSYRVEAPAIACSAPTLTLGDPSTSSSCVTKLNAAGHQVFTVRIGGGGVEALRLDSAGNVYVWGLAGPTGAGFATTPGAYESNPPGAPDPFVCKLSTNDGHAVFCTFIDVSGAFTVDSSGNSYLAGTCGSDFDHICVEKLNSAGTALVYRASLIASSNASAAHVAVDAQGDLFIAQSNAGIVKLDSSGILIATSTGLGNDLPGPLALDPAGEPQVILVDATSYGNMRLRRYAANLETILFETPLVISYLPFFTSGGALLMGVDSAGVTNIVGSTYGINLSPVHPTQTCSQPFASSGSAFLARLDVHGNLLQFTYLGIPANFLSETPIVLQSDHASLLYFTITEISAGNWAILTLGPGSSEVTLSCIGDGATFTYGPLSPNEIVSLFGAGIGPAQPVFAQPDARSIYPFQLGGTQVTFDGVAAPLVYVSANQINLVTPRALQGKTTTHVCATVSDVPTNCLDVPVQPVTPEIFLSSGLHAAALNQDGTINSAANPAPVGSIVSVFATGLGAITALPDGAITPWPPSQYPGVQMQATAYLSVSTQITVPTNVLYAGPAPLEVEGVAQINFVIPAINFTGFPGRTVSYTLKVPSPEGSTSAFSFSNGVQIWTK